MQDISRILFEQHLRPLQILTVHLPRDRHVEFSIMHSTEMNDELGIYFGLETTTLEAWFKANAEYEEARELLYIQFPSSFYWNHRNKIWIPRRRKLTNPPLTWRMEEVLPSEIQRYSLLMILQHVRGAQSFQDLRTINGVQYPDFIEAAEALNLI